jgi:LmbE family N-acetylglucosaminyl deacetylase
LSRRSVERWSSPGGRRVLVVAPHPDDEVIGCGGTLIRHLRCGDDVRVVCVTDGRRSRALGLTPGEMAASRRQEADAAASALGIAPYEWLGLREGEWDDDRLRADLSGVIERYAPDVLYAPSRIDFHPEHLRVAHVIATLPSAQWRAAPLVRVYQVQVPLTARLVNLVADVSAVLEQCRAAARVYATQWGSIARTFRMRRYAGCCYGASGWIEEFWQMTFDEYRSLHGSPHEQWVTTVFRTLRVLPFRDPLAYLAGRAERNRLACRVKRG